MKKLVCIAYPGQWKNPKGIPMTTPKRGELVTIIGTGGKFTTNYVVKGYETGPLGNSQTFSPRGFRPPVDISSEVMESFTTVHETIEPLVLEPA